MIPIKINSNIIKLYQEHTDHVFDELDKNKKFENRINNDLKKLLKYHNVFGTSHKNKDLSLTIRDIIKMNPEEMKDLCLGMHKYFTTKYKDRNEKHYKYLLKFSKSYYSKFSTKGKYIGKPSNGYCSQKWIKRIGVNTCPYCNLSYTKNIITYNKTKHGRKKKNENEHYKTFQIDHFHPKSRFPFLAVSFYNLIPSCSYCNHRKKEKILPWNPFQHISYDTDLRTTLFPIIKSYDPKKSFSTQTTIKIASLDIDLKVNIEKLYIEELYQQHDDYVAELLEMARPYPRAHINTLKGLLQQHGYNKYDIYRMIYRNYSNQDNYHKRPMAKLTKDILKSLGIKV
jgi:hypothetical protein